MTENESTLQDRIDALFLEAEQGDEATREFARDSLNGFRQECQSALEWQRTEGRARVIGGEDPARIRERAEAMIARARERLHGKLTSLVKWAREAGRIGGEE